MHRVMAVFAGALCLGLFAPIAHAWTPVAGGRLNEVMIEDFEDGVLHQYGINPKVDGFSWQQVTGSGAGQFTWQIDTTMGAAGTGKSMKMTCQSGSPYFWYLTNSKNGKFLYGYEKPVNRMGFYIKLPAGWKRSYYTLSDGRSYCYSNFHVGTFEADPNVLLGEDTSETSNWHFYYHLLFNMYDTGWVRVVLGKWPQNQREQFRVPGVNPTRPVADMFGDWTRVYFQGNYPDQSAEIAYPYDVWLDQWSFYYEKDYVTISPEYGQGQGLPGASVSYPVVITNTHPSETREFGLNLTNQLNRAANYWTYDVHLYTDTNGNGARDAGENLQPTSTGTLAPGGKWKGILVVNIPPSGAGSEIGAYVVTSLIAWQKAPVYSGLDPHISPGRLLIGGVPQNAPPATDVQGVLRGTPMTGLTVNTTTVSSLPPADTMPPAAINDLRLLAIGPHDAKLRWTASGDDGAAAGTAYAYEARYSTSPITPTNWDSATELTGEPDPNPAGAPQTWYLPPEFDTNTHYYLAIRVIDEAGNRSELSNVVDFTTSATPPTNVPPTAAATANVTSGPTPLTVQFSGTGSSDSDGSIALYVWDFGDGVISNEPNPAHTFDVVGTNTIKLTVFDNAGAADSRQLTISPTRGVTGRVLLRKDRDGYASGLANQLLDIDPSGVRPGGTGNFKVGSYGGRNRAVYQFANLGASLALPAHSEVTNARLWIYQEGNNGFAGPSEFPAATVELYALSQTYAPSEVSWNFRSSGVLWPTAGAIPTGATPYAVIASDYHTRLMRACDVTGLVSGGQDVLNVALRVTTETTAGYTFLGTHEFPELQRPTLIVSYGPIGSRPPVAQDGEAVTNDGLAVDITLAASDANDDPLTYGIVSGPSHGQLSSLDGDSLVTYTPTAGYVGTDSFTFKANDGSADSNVATVTITIKPANVAPVAQDGMVQTDAGVALDITLVATDGNGDALTYSIVTGPSHGQLSGPVSGNHVTYTPNVGFSGSDSFTFKANDGKLDSNTATVQVDVVWSGPATVGFQNGVLPDPSYVGCADTWIFTLVPDGNYGLNEWGNGMGQYAGVKRSLIRFDLSSVPADVRILSANLRLNMCKVDRLLTLEVYQALRPWTRDGCTWNRYDGVHAWSIAGGGGVGSDRAAAPAASLDVSATGWADIPLSTALVQGWVSGTTVNNGLLLKVTNETDGEMRFWGENYAAPADRPMLVITYALAGDVDGNGHIDVVDLLYLVDAFGSAAGDANYDARCDFNSDGSVDVIDLLMLVENFGK